MDVIGAGMLNFKPILDHLWKKIVKETPVPDGGALARLGHSLARQNLGAQHPLGTKIWSSKKSIWVGRILPLNLRD